MKVTTIRTLLDAIGNIIGEDMAWVQKREAILAEASDADKANLEEFSAWFDITTLGGDK